MAAATHRGNSSLFPAPTSQAHRATLRRGLFIAALALVLVTATAQGAWAASSEPIVSVAVRFAESIPVRNLPAKSTKLFDGKPSVRTHEINEVNEKPLRTADPNARRDIDGALSGNAARGVTPLALPAPIQNFSGITLADTIAIGQGFLPPDTNGEVGPNHFVQTVNSAFRVFSKTGVPLTPTATLSSLFAPLGPPCGPLDDGDPIVNYDQLADRWLISQFCIPSGDPNVGPFHQVIAVSKTGDPTGAYYLYDFVTQGTNIFPDYPHLGVWPDAYYMTVNQFSPTAFVDSGMYAFNRAKMIAGDPTAGYIYFNANGAPLGGAGTIGGMLPADLDGFTLPPAGSPCPHAYFTATEFADPSDGIRLYDFHVDFAVPANSTFTERAGSPLPVAAFDPVTVPNTRNVVPQPGVGATSFLDAINDRLMFRLAYRNFGSKETLVANHTVNAAVNPAYRAGVRVYQLSRPTAIANWVVDEQTTWAGLVGDTTHRWMGSAAQNRAGDLAVGFSASSATVSPSVRYAVRLSTDLAGTGLAQGEQTLIAGSGAQTSTSGRWGDYSDLSIDPADDCTFWYTQEFMNGGANWQTRIGSFQTGAPCAPAPPTGTIQGIVTYCSNGLPVAGALVQFTGGLSRATDGSGNYSIALAPGTYTVTVSGVNYSTATVPGQVVTASATTTVNVCLVGTLKQPVSDTVAVTADTCPPTNSVLDPNEGVTVNLGLKNTGTLDTSNLVATLQATGGVTAPGAPQNYGIVAASGPTIVRPFTFTVGNVACGSTVTLTVQLQDGATNLGTTTFTLPVGVLSSTIATTGNIAVAIPDNNVTGVDVPIVVPNVGAITDVNVSVRLNHTFAGDLRIDLVHPDNTIVNLVNHRGGGGNDFGTGVNDCSGTSTQFDDQAPTAITAGSPPWAGAFRPEALLSALNTKPSAGTWKLRVSDNAALDTGTVGCVKIELNKVFTCCGVQIVAAPPASITSESFVPLNSAIDPSETVTVSFPLKNSGGSPTTNLVATLQASGGVTLPSAPQTYGVIASNGTTSMPFSFRAAGVCGGTLTATLSLQDGVLSAGSVSFPFLLGTTSSVTSFTQNFDSVVPPALPAGWTSTHTGGTADFVTSLTGSDTAPNDAFAPDNTIVSNIQIDTPSLSPASQLTFRNLYNLEASGTNPTSGFDGMVLEISIDGGPFADIITAGGAFVTGGYTRTISASFSNPLAGRQAWSGLSGGTTAAPTYITSTVTLPSGANTLPFVLRWRVGTDTSAAAAGLSGVRIDTIVTSANVANCSTPVNLLNFSVD